MMRTIFLTTFGMLLFSLVNAQTVNATDKEGKKQGPWEKYYPDGEYKRYEGQFKDDVPVGKFVYYYEKGEVQTVLIHRGEGRTSAKNFFPNGELLATGVYVNQVKDSTWTYYNQYGEKVAVEYYILGKKYGNCMKYHPNGQILEERYFENNLEHGPFKQYYDNGILAREGMYKFGSLEGEAAFYHRNGQVRYEGIYLKDVKEGIWITYDEKGNVTDERRYHKGIPEYRESDILFEDSTKYIRKDKLEMEDFIEEDFMAIPTEEEEKKAKKKKK